jgi:glutamyl-tRNA synthetase
VLANPARFDEKKATAINGTHIRMLEAADFRGRLVPYLQAAGLVGEALTDRENAILDAGAPLVQERVALLGEAVDMLAFLFQADADIRTADGALKGMPADLPAALAAARAGLDGIDAGSWTVESIEAALRAALIDGLGLKPRQAFGPVRTAVSGKKVSPPLFESLEILGKDSTLSRLDRFAAEQAEQQTAAGTPEA